jgi:ATP phosphoribosyltransferase regulatory subunit HisZ
VAAEEMDGSPLQQDLLREAADGLKQIARAVEGKSIGAMAGELSEFGRHNPVAYLGGAALVGFALARFARASTAEEKAPSYPASGFDAGPADQSGSDNGRSSDRYQSGTELPSGGLAGGPENA